jgi:hypothetical protein
LVPAPCAIGEAGDYLPVPVGMACKESMVTAPIVVMLYDGGVSCSTL